MFRILSTWFMDNPLESVFIVLKYVHFFYRKHNFFISFHFRWKGIVIVGGDGTFYEVLNGIFARPDWQDVLKQLPLGVIPSGTGNGLSR